MADAVTGRSEGARRSGVGAVRTAESLKSETNCADLCLYRHWGREPDLRSLLHIDPTHPTTSLEFISTGLSGEITGYREVTTTADARTAANSTSMERKPADYQGSFVRGKSSYFPFRPGGLGHAILTGEEEDSTDGTPTLAVEGLEKAFEKGRGTISSASSVQMQQTPC
jgi:hypothetical protein